MSKKRSIEQTSDGSRSNYNKNHMLVKTKLSIMMLVTLVVIVVVEVVALTELEVQSR